MCDGFGQACKILPLAGWARLYNGQPRYPDNPKSFFSVLPGPKNHNCTQDLKKKSETRRLQKKWKQSAAHKITSRRQTLLIRTCGTWWLWIVDYLLALVCRWLCFFTFHIHRPNVSYPSADHTRFLPWRPSLNNDMSAGVDVDTNNQSTHQPYPTHVHTNPHPPSSPVYSITTQPPYNVSALTRIA